MKNLLAVCLATAIVLSVGTTELEGMKRITVEKTCIPAEQLRTWDGAELYQNLCSTCHGDTGLGDGPAARELALQPANLTLLARESGGRYPSQAVFSSISGRHVSTDLHLDMPRW